MIKPLGGKAYGSIPHLPGSRLGPGDHHISEGQARIATEQRRDKHDRIYVQEKLDGSNVAIARINGQILALTRAGYLANTSKYEQHHRFHNFVNNHSPVFQALLADGERLCGEWLAQAVGTKYRLSHHSFAPFVAFDIIRGNTRCIVEEFAQRVTGSIPYAYASTFVVEDFAPVTIDMAAAHFGEFGHHGAQEQIEGYIWRVERYGKVDFITKYVRPDKVDGKYLPENNDTGQIIWNE